MRRLFKPQPDITFQEFIALFQTLKAEFPVDEEKYAKLDKNVTRHILEIETTQNKSFWDRLFN